MPVTLMDRPAMTPPDDPDAAPGGTASLDAALLDTLFASAPVGFAFFDRDLRYRRVNEALARINGVPAAEHIGRGVLEVLPHQDPAVVESLRTVLATGEPIVNAEAVGRTPAAPDDERVWLVSYYPVRDRDSRETLGLGAIVLDVTEQRRAEAALRESQEQTRVFLKDMMYSVSEGKLWLCDTPDEMPAPLPAYGEPVALSSRTLRDLRRITVDAALDAEMPPDRWQDYVTAVGEAAMNAVVHGGGGIGRVCADPASGRVQVWIEDTGAGIALGHLHRATLERGYTTANTLGHGFWIMLKTCDRVYLRTGADGTTVALEQGRRAAEPAWMGR